MLTLELIEEETVRTTANIDDLIDSLLSVLKKEIEVYEDLRLVITEEEISLKRPSLFVLSESNARKETLILKTKMLEEARNSIVKRIAKINGIEERDVNLTFLSCHTDGHRERELKDLQTVLLELLHYVNDKNEKNRALIDYSLSYVRNTMDFVGTILSTGADYVSTGKLRAGKMNGKLLYKEG